MKTKPIIRDSLYTTHTNYVVDLKLDFNVTFICGDSGTGKSAIYSFIKELSTEDNTIKCYNYLDIKSNYKSAIKRSKGKLFVIDNADILLNDAMRQYIATDSVNQYIIIGRNPAGLLLTYDSIYELISEHKKNITVFSLKRNT